MKEKIKRAERPATEGGEEERVVERREIPPPCGMPVYHQGGWVCIGCGATPWHCLVEECGCIGEVYEPKVYKE